MLSLKVILFPSNTLETIFDTIVSHSSCRYVDMFTHQYSVVITVSLLYSVLMGRITPTFELSLHFGRPLYFQHAYKYLAEYFKLLLW